MRFEPKLIRGDEPPLNAGGELDLPEDLAALGEQLGDDARHLAACYPAPSTANFIPRTIQRSWWRIAVASAAAVAIALTSIFAVNSRWHGQSLATISNDASTPQQPTGPTFVSTPVTTQAISLTDLSAPELEALLDLVEGQPHDAVRVSF
jgi:hypothetical protein